MNTSFIGLSAAAVAVATLMISSGATGAMASHGEPPEYRTERGNFECDSQTTKGRQRQPAHRRASRLDHHRPTVLASAVISR
ncbi:MAG: hypothetical protein ACR2HR_08565 [Euzebya sp.]